MNKSDLIERVVSATKASKVVATKAVNTVFEAFSSALKKGDKVSIVGFGTFSVAQQKARKGRNPQTGEAIKIKAKKTPKFKAGKKLKEAVQRKK